jgi:hypothetical protein
MALSGRAFGKAHDQASCEVARSVSRRIGLPDSVSNGLYDIHEWWNGQRLEDRTRSWTRVRVPWPSYSDGCRSRSFALGTN